MFVILETRPIPPAEIGRDRSNDTSLSRSYRPPHVTSRPSRSSQPTRSHRSAVTLYRTRLALFPRKTAILVENSKFFLSRVLNAPGDVALKPKQAVGGWPPRLCLPLQVDNIFVFIRQVAPVPACWLFKTSATKLTFDLLTLKVVSESRVTWATSVPILVFLGLPVLDLGPMYATDIRSDRRQTKA